MESTKSSQIVQKIRPCRFFNSTEGCRNGDNCLFSHSNVQKSVNNKFNNKNMNTKTNSKEINYICAKCQTNDCQKQSEGGIHHIIPDDKLEEMSFTWHFRLGKM
jgi:hypothetical protein